ncbi:MAG: hypothetical protein GSR85_09815 [Desulfurococcales archaeon]|nr:hypothetical protein [Desulfurococcales archaeon]
MNLFTRISALILLSIILLSITPIQSTAEISEANIRYSATRDSYNVTAVVSGYNKTLENVTATIYLSASPTDFKLNADIDTLTSNFTSLNITGTGNMSTRQINDTVVVETLNKFLLMTRVNSSALSMGGAIEEYEMLPLTISIDKLYTRTIQRGLNYTNTSIVVNALFNLSKGLNYLPIPAPIPLKGDLALAINSSIKSIIINNSIEFNMDLQLESKSGVQAVDVILINMLYQMVSLYLTEDMLRQMLLSMGIEIDDISLNIEQSKDDPRVLIISIYFKGKQLVTTQPMPNMGQMPSMQFNLTEAPFTFITTSPFNSSASWSYNLTSYSISESIYAVNITVTAEGEASSPITQEGFIESLEINATIDKGYYRVDVSCSGKGNPLASFNMLMSILRASLESNLTESIKLDITTKDISLLDTSQMPARELIGTIILTKDNIPESVGVSYDDTILSIHDKTLKASSTSTIEADLSLIASVKDAIVEAPGFMIKTRTPAIAARDFNLEIMYGSERAEVNINRGTVISGETLFKIVDRDLAVSYAEGANKRVIGTPLEVNGIMDGELEIGLLLDEIVEPEKVSILEVKPDGTIVIIKDVEIRNGKAYFNTSSFSVFIPVTEVEETGGVVTTTTTTTTEETTETTTKTTITETETEETTTPTTTETRETTTTTIEEITETTTETTTETKETTTTTETTEKTTEITYTAPTTGTTTTEAATTKPRETTPTATTTEKPRETTTTTEETKKTTTTEEPTEMASLSETTETIEEKGMNWTLIAVVLIVIIALIGAILFIKR